jgi:hypothetical protein
MRVIAASPIRVRVTVTPQQAKAWLENNTHNRSMRELHWMSMALDMLEGRWKYNGDAVRFSADGTLLDGQHRLRACIEAQVPFETDVVFGLDPAVMDTIDIGRARRASDVVTLNGGENSGINAVCACAAACLVLIHQKHGLHRVQCADVYPTKTEISSFVLAHPRLGQIAGHAAGLGRHLAPPRVMATCYYLFSEQNAELAEQFFNDLAEGTNLSRKSPIYHLRERMVANRGSKRKMQLIEILALFFKAWMAYRDQKSVDLLRWAPGNNEMFPDISLEYREARRAGARNGETARNGRS